jgi:hypothetical protein
MGSKLEKNLSAARLYTTFKCGLLSFLSVVKMNKKLREKMIFYLANKKQ